MPITTIKIHPAIGIARVGNSPADFFIGPEIPGDHTLPAGGYKDAQCRVKRQAARFRLFAYDQNGTLVKEITAADGTITWTVHLANKKAATGRNSGVPAADVTIDPGPRSITGPNQSAAFDTGKFKVSSVAAVTVPLGEVRTDVDGRLLVLGGFGKSVSPTNRQIASFLNNDEWYDDISDGPVTATVQIGAKTFTAVGAWVISPPPKFSPATDSIITLYDTLYQWAVEKGWLAVPAPVSYTQHIYPILQRAMDTKWVNLAASSHHGFTHPVYDDPTRQLVWNKLKKNNGNMPLLNDGLDSVGDLTDTQYALLEAWKNNVFTQDWAGVPIPPNAVTPGGLDRAALENCAGAAFYPGIEAGGYPLAQAPFRDRNNFEPFRLDHALVAAGDITKRMALPWQADFKACSFNWWPVPRPNQVLPQAGGSYQDWDRGVGTMEDMAAQWHTLGFVVEQGSQHVEVDRCDAPSITLVTPALNFVDIPQGPGGVSRKQGLAVTFEVQSTMFPVTLWFDSGPTHVRLRRSTPSPVVINPTPGGTVSIGRLWITYETGSVGEVLTDQVRVSHVQSGLIWTIPITANTIARKTTAVSLVLDRSGSMTEDRGDGTSKVQSLRDSAIVFLDKMLPGDGLGIVRYNQEAQRLQDILAVGDPTDPFEPNRVASRSVLLGPDLNPQGATSIGDGIFEGRVELGAASGYDQKALVVLTDGKENQPRWISDVASSIDNRTYAVGLGTAANTSAAALQTLSGNTGGYLLITGSIADDNFFLLQKYFLQILAGVSNAEVVLDPDGILTPGASQIVPVRFTEQDMAVDVVLLTPYPQYVDFRLRTPTGQIITPASTATNTGIQYVVSRGMAYYRVILPTELQPQRFDHGGTWQVLLSIGRSSVERTRSEVIVGSERSSAAPPARFVGRGTSADIAMPEFETMLARTGVTIGHGVRGLRYSVVVHAYSNISLRVHGRQASYEPGAAIELLAYLTESGIPLSQGVSVWAEVSQPAGTVSRVNLAPQPDGSFVGRALTSIPGTYRVRVRATGVSERGLPFDREQDVTAAVWTGGDRQPIPGAGGDPGDRLCELLCCLLGPRGAISAAFAERLARMGFDVRSLQRCLKKCCDRRALPENERVDTGSPSDVIANLPASQLRELLEALQRRLSERGLE